METPKFRIRTEVLNRLQSSILKKESKDYISSQYLSELSSRLILIENYNERKEIINTWYKDLLSADKLRKFHLGYKKPGLTKELNMVLSSLTLKFKKQFYNYFS